MRKLIYAVAFAASVAFAPVAYAADDCETFEQGIDETAADKATEGVGVAYIKLDSEQTAAFLKYVSVEPIADSIAFVIFSNLPDMVLVGAYDARGCAFNFVYMPIDMVAADLKGAFGDDAPEWNEHVASPTDPGV